MIVIVPVPRPAGCLCLGLVVSKIVSESADRWAPPWFVVLIVVTAAVGAGSNRR